MLKYDHKISDRPAAGRTATDHYLFVKCAELSLREAGGSSSSVDPSLAVVELLGQGGKIGYALRIGDAFHLSHCNPPRMMYVSIWLRNYRTITCLPCLRLS
jgi:hypothetical protein